MGSDQSQAQNKITCALCEKSDETEITGPLSSKESISAHQNCLLFASGLYCQNSPTFDDLFGFEVEDVKKEMKRGKRLSCHRCKKSGATAGCEKKKCKRSYHYPCAIEDCARTNEDTSEGRFMLFCKLHDPESKKTKKKSADGERPDLKKPERRNSNSSTGLSEKRESPIVLDSDDDDIECMHAPVESDIEDCTPPNQNNQSTPDPESKRPCAGPSPSTRGSLNLTSAQKAGGSADNPGELHGRSIPYPYMYRACMNRSPKVRRPRRSNRKRIQDSGDKSPTSNGRVVAPAMSIQEDSVCPKQPSQSTPVLKKTRLCENLNPLTTEADDDTDIDSEESESLLLTKTYCITVPCTVIVDSGASEHSLPSSPAGAAPAAVCTPPGSVTTPEHKETPSTSRSSPPPRAQTTDPVSPGTICSMATLDYFIDDPSDQPGSPQHSSPAVDVPAVSTSTVQTISASPFKSKRLPVLSPPAGVSSSPGRPAAADASDLSTTVNSESSAAIFWTRCNEAGWTKEIFSDFVSQMNSLGERVQSQEASQQDYDVALKVLGVSGQLPCIVTQLEQDLEKQKQDLQRKKAALRDAKAVLGV